MANQVRFTQLVKASGRPHSATLWVADPAEDPEFKKAIADNRIVTVHLVNVGGKKESGEIGFVKGGAASYLIFPKSLPLAEGTRVIGLKFDMLEDPKVKDPVKIEHAKRKTKIEHANIVEFPKSETTKPSGPERASEKHSKPKHSPKKKAEPPPKQTSIFHVTVEFSARQTKQFEIETTSASDAIERALKEAKSSPPEPDWKLDATDVKRRD
jgi:hypothetical protein